MTDDTSKNSPDKREINVDDMHDVRSWMLGLGCTEVELRLAVRAVGPSADAVEGFLAKGRK
jgi:hypothetical protein